MDTKKLDKQYIANTYARNDLVFVKGSGSELFSDDGTRYIDMGSGIAVCSFGHCDEEWQEAVKLQLGLLSHVSNLYYSLPQVQLAELLCKKTGMSRVFFCSSGAEANEAAIKTARKYSFDKYGSGRSSIITLKNSFHGRTLGALSATGQPALQCGFEPLVPGFLYTQANDIDSLNAIYNKSCCAVMIELIQGECGVNPLSPEFVQAAVNLCKQNDMLLIADEVQTGIGRTGKLFCCEHHGILPDIITTAKGLAGGLPLGAVLFANSTKDTLTPGSHGTTFGGNPVAAAGGVNIISRLTPQLLAEVSEKGEYLKTRLTQCKGAIEVTGRGLMVGIKAERPASELLPILAQKGIIALSAKDRLRLLPALTIPFDMLRHATDIIIETLLGE